MDNNIYAVGINASVPGGHSDKLLGKIARGMQQYTQNQKWGCTVRFVQLVGDEFNLPKFHRDLPQTKVVTKLINLLARADGIIYCTPVHWFGPSAEMQNLLSWLTLTEKGWRLEGKPVGLAACCDTDGGQAAVSAMAATLNHLGCAIPPHCMFFENTTITGNIDLRGHEQKWMVDDATEVVGANVAQWAMINKLYNIR